MPEETRYAIGDLADLGGVSRRTVRYYVQEGLLPTPFGVGRGDHYGPEHLDRLLRVKALQEAGQSLEEIRRALHGDERAPVEALSAASAEPRLSREVWRRVTLAPGVELHVSGDVRLPSPGKLAELAGWCRQNLPGGDPSGDRGV
ncbi:MAG TPA: MerR family transcriptional regulator [Vicinamibacterales bacterium]|nr:MerR family transcriptional regulator [Vicinamibacterales bacterium]